MQELVYEREGMVVTDSLTLAEAFNKGHDKVLRDIRNIRCSEQFKQRNIKQSFYANRQGREMPMYYLTYEAFVFIAMSYTGSKTSESKELFILDFGQRYRNASTNQDDAKLLADSITIRSNKQKLVQKAVRDRIYRDYAHVPDKARRKYFSLLYKRIKAEYDVPSFRDIREKDFSLALEFINGVSLQMVESNTEEKENIN